MMKPSEATRKPKDVPHCTVSKSDCHVRSRGKTAHTIRSLSCKKDHRSQIQMGMCADYLQKEMQEMGTLGVSGWGQGWGDFTVYFLYPLNVVLRAHFYLKK